MDARKRPARRQAAQGAKQAVRAYAPEPSRANADAVQTAWRKVQQLQAQERDQPLQRVLAVALLGR